jgi:hypothetical protein
VAFCINFISTFLTSNSNIFKKQIIIDIDIPATKTDAIIFNIAHTFYTLLDAYPLKILVTAPVKLTTLTKYK